MSQATVTGYNTNFSDTFPFSNTCFNTLLAASTAISYTVPGDPNQQYRANFSVSSSADVWVRLNGTAVVPVSNTSQTTSYQERIGQGFSRYVNGGDTLSFIGTSTSQVGVSLLLVQQ
jgi:hypothetical protein